MLLLIFITILKLKLYGFLVFLKVDITYIRMEFQTNGITYSYHIRLTYTIRYVYVVSFYYTSDLPFGIVSPF